MSEATPEPIFSAEETLVLSSVLDEIIPPGGSSSLPGAGTLGVAAFVAGFVHTMPMLRPVIEQGLSSLARLSASRAPGGFTKLAADGKQAVLEELAAADQAFLPTLTFVAYVGYYQHPRIVSALGLEPRPPHPKGYEMEPNDLSLLDGVRRRPKMYREVE